MPPARRSGAIPGTLILIVAIGICTTFVRRATTSNSIERPRVRSVYPFAPSVPPRLIERPVRNENAPVFPRQFTPPPLPPAPRLTPYRPAQPTVPPTRYIYPRETPAEHKR